MPRCLDRQDGTYREGDESGERARWQRPARGLDAGAYSGAFFMVALDTLVATTALPVTGRDLHAGMQALQ